MTRSEYFRALIEKARQDTVDTAALALSDGVFNPKSTHVNLSIERGPYKVELEWAGEGRCGDYDPEDPYDYPHLRFYCSTWDANDMEWECIDDASYCTTLPKSLPPSLMAIAADMILRRLEDVGEAGAKKAMEEMSWIDLGVLVSCTEDGHVRLP